MGCSRRDRRQRSHGLGAVAAAADDLTTAREHWMRALAHYRTLRAPQAADVERRLAALDG